MAEAKGNLKKYLAELTTRHEILVDLLTNFNDGRSKAFYCQTVNLLPLEALMAVMKRIDADLRKPQLSAKEKAATVRELFESKARDMNISLTLRK